MKLVVFDCDGTIVDSQHLIVEAMTRGFAGEGLVAPGRNEILSVVGLSLPQAVGVLMPGAAPDAVMRVAEGYKAAFGALRRDPAHHEPLFDGLAATIDALSARDDMLLGIATGKSRRGVDALLERTGLADRFVTIQTADDNPSKPSPVMLLRALSEAGGISADRAVMIGDTTFDIDMALSARMKAIGVAWGYHPVAALEGRGAHVIASAGSELVSLVDRLIGDVESEMA
ncbi:MAG: HAD-IA family hydrolase [Hyphomicrobiaceae bacterium]